MGYDATKTSYWAATGSTIYSSTSLPTFTAVPDPGVGSDLINGLFVDSTNGVVFIATKTRGVFFTKDGGATWTRILAETPQGSSNPASFLTVAGPVDVSAVPPNDKYHVGSDGTNSLGFGYYTLSLSASTLTRFPDTTILLYSSSVSRILVDTTSTPGFVNVLLGTNFNGLWRGVFDPTTGQILSGTNLYWIHE